MNFLEVAGAVQRFNSSVDHYRYSVTIFGFIHVVRGYKNRDPTVGSFVNHFPELAPHGRIDSAGRFIKKNNLRRVKNSYRKSEFLLPTQRQGFNQSVSFTFEPQPVKQFIRFFFYLFVCQPVNPTKKAYIFPYFQVFVQRKPLAHISDAAFYLLVFFQDIVSGHRPFSRCRLADSAQHLHGGGFPGAVSTQETEYFPFADIEGDTVNSGEVAKLFRQSRDIYYNITFHSSRFTCQRHETILHSRRRNIDLHF